MQNQRNLLVLLCDQLQQNILGPYGGRVPTPNWDRLASSGVVFDHFYCADPLCVPARASLMTGRWPHAHGAISFGKGYEALRPGEELLIDRLFDSGYQVGYEGVWHINRPEGEERLGDYARFNPANFPYGEHLRMLVAQGGKEGEQRRVVRTPSDTGVEEWTFSVPVPARWTDPLDAHPDMVLARSAADFILSAPADRPFAAWCSLGGPHPPLLIPEPYYSAFSPDEMEPPVSFGEDSEGLPRSVWDGPGTQSVRDWPWERWAVATAAYWGFVAFTDACLGAVLDALEASGRANETVMVATCDHGEMLGAHNIYQKGVLYDEAVRLPFVLASPDVLPGKRSQLASQVDLAPTLLDLLGLPPLERAQGQSLLPALKDPSASGQDAVFMEFNGNIKGGVYTRGVVSRQYKYIYHHGDIDQLFDQHADPAEMHNLARDPKYAGERQSLRDRLTQWMVETGDFLKPIWPA